MKEVARCEVLTTILMKIQVFWNGTQRRLVRSVTGVSKSVFHTYIHMYMHIYIYIYKAKHSNELPEGAMFFRNVCSYLPVDTV
jgi:hypothetical protein